MAIEVKRFDELTQKSLLESSGQLFMVDGSNQPFRVNVGANIANLAGIGADGIIKRSGGVVMSISTIQTADIANGAVNGDKLSVSAVNTTHITDQSVTTPKYADESITLAKLAPEVKEQNQLDAIIFAVALG